MEKTCGWKCGDNTPGQNHYTVIIREDGKLLGRLSPEGKTVNRKIHAAILSKVKANQIANEINADKSRVHRRCASFLNMKPPAMTIRTGSSTRQPVDPVITTNPCGSHHESFEPRSSAQSILRPHGHLSTSGRKH